MLSRSRSGGSFTTLRTLRDGPGSRGGSLAGEMRVGFRALAGQKRRSRSGNAGCSSPAWTIPLHTCLQTDRKPPENRPQTDRKRPAQGLPTGETRASR